MNTPDKVLRYLQSHAGTERTIAEALNETTSEVFRVLSVLLENDRVELYQSQSGDEMYRCKPRVHLEQRRGRPNTATTWGTPLILEEHWVRNEADDVVALDESPNDEGEALPEVSPEPSDAVVAVALETPAAAPDKPVKKRKSVPFTPLSWDEKELNDEEYTEKYYESL